MRLLLEQKGWGNPAFCYIWGMRTEKKPYTSLAHTLQMMSKQIVDSLDYADGFLPKYTTPQEIWYILKDNLIYKSDPPGIELLQSFPSLMLDNYWGTPGMGDCDCFTIAAVSCAKVRDIPTRVVVVGNKASAPSHVYSQILVNGSWVNFDLVSSEYGTTRPYKFQQMLKVH